MLYLLYRIGRLIALSLPLKVVYGLADVLASFYYYLAKNDRKIITNNISVVLNQTDHSPLVRYTSRMVFRNFGHYLGEFFRTPKIDLQYLEKFVKIEGRKNLDDALKLGRGILLVGAHLGNWELGAMALSMLGYNVSVVAWSHQNKQINEFFFRQRQSKGLKVIPLGAGIRKVFLVLHHNEIVALLADIDYAHPQTGITVELFGRDTIMPKGPAVFSLKMAAPVIPTFTLIEKPNRLRIILEEPIVYAPSENWESDVIGLTKKIAKIIEGYISRYPTQWFMFTPRWQSDAEEDKKGVA